MEHLLPHAPRRRFTLIAGVSARPRSSFGHPRPMEAP